MTLTTHRIVPTDSPIICKRKLLKLKNWSFINNPILIIIWSFFIELSLNELFFSHKILFAQMCKITFFIMLKTFTVRKKYHKKLRNIYELLPLLFWCEISSKVPTWTTKTKQVHKYESFEKIYEKSNTQTWAKCFPCW